MANDARSVDSPRDCQALRTPAGYVTGLEPVSPHASNGSTADTAPPSLFTLPQELQDIIFDLAYPQVDVAYIHRSEWNTREAIEWREARRNYTKKPFPRPLVDTFLVSKAFFIAAAKAWTGNQDFKKSISFSQPFCRSMEGIIPAFAKTITTDRIGLYDVLEAASLRSLTLLVPGSMFLCIEDEVLVWEDELSEKHFQQVADRHLYFLGQLSREVRVRLEAGEVSMGGVKTTTAWKSNVANLETYLRKQRILGHGRLTAHGEGAGCTQSQEPHGIYLNSAVRYDPTDGCRNTRPKGQLLPSYNGSGGLDGTSASGGAGRRADDDDSLALEPKSKTTDRAYSGDTLTTSGAKHNTKTARNDLVIDVALSEDAIESSSPSKGAGLHGNGGSPVSLEVLPLTKPESPGVAQGLGQADGRRRLGKGVWRHRRPHDDTSTARDALEAPSLSEISPRQSGDAQMSDSGVMEVNSGAVVEEAVNKGRGDDGEQPTATDNLSISKHDSAMIGSSLELELRLRQSIASLSTEEMGILTENIANVRKLLSEGQDHGIHTKDGPTIVSRELKQSLVVRLKFRGPGIGRMYEITSRAPVLGRNGTGPSRQQTESARATTLDTQLPLSPMSPRGSRPAQRTQILDDSQVPETAEALSAILNSHGQELIAWVRDAKLRPRFSGSGVENHTETDTPSKKGWKTFFLGVLYGAIYFGLAIMLIIFGMVLPMPEDLMISLFKAMGGNVENLALVG